MGNGIKGYYFAIVLYDEDPFHVHILKYIQSLPLWLDYYVLICHNMDAVEGIRYSKSEEEMDALLPVKLEKKRHYHVLLRLKTRTSLKAFLSMFEIRNGRKALNYALCLCNPYAYVTYMLHADFASLHDDKKFKYKYDDLIYSNRALALLDSQNGYFVQYFRDIMSALKDGQDLFSIIDNALDTLSPRDAEEYLRIVRSYQYLFVQRGSMLPSLKNHINFGG